MFPECMFESENLVGIYYWRRIELILVDISHITRYYSTLKKSYPKTFLENYQFEIFMLMTQVMYVKFPGQTEKTK